VLVATSRIWRTTCTVLRSGSEAFVVDSPVLPDELEVLPAVLEQSGFPFSGLLVTHADWDHLLGRYAFGDATIGCAETTAARLAGEPGAAQRSLRDFDERHYVQRPGPLGLGSVQALPVPGRIDIGGHDVELHPADGHTADGMAVWAEWVGVLCCGDYLSPVEIPMLSAGGSRSAYLATLARLEPLVGAATWVVPGHGEPLDSARALAILREDRAYLEALPGAELPLARRTSEQRRIHAENVARQ
jgi:glyoxylase-like metal-dependent hydrolase (beta-lactamase superfamily II)